MADETKTVERGNVRALDVLSFLWSKKLLVIVVIAVLAVSAFFYGKLFVKPSYVSETKMVVISSSDTGKITSSDITVSTYLVTDYVEMVVDRTVLEEVIDELNLKMSYSDIKGLVKVENPENSRILKITVTTESAKLSQRIAQKISEVAKVKFINILGVDKVNVFSKANLPLTNSAITPTVFALVGAFAAIVLLVIIAVICVYFDDKIKTADDIEKYLGLCTLATIPYNASNPNAKQRKRKRKAASK